MSDYLPEEKKTVIEQGIDCFKKADPIHLVAGVGLVTIGAIVTLTKYLGKTNGN